MVALFWNLVLALVLALHSYCRDNVKYGLLSKHLFQIKRQYSSWKSHLVTTNMEKNMEKKTFIEASYIYNILEKKLFPTATFEGL